MTNYADQVVAVDITGDKDFTEWLSELIGRLAGATTKRSDDTGLVLLFRVLAVEDRWLGLWSNADGQGGSIAMRAKRPSDGFAHVVSTELSQLSDIVAFAAAVEDALKAAGYRRKPGLFDELELEQVTDEPSPGPSKTKTRDEGGRPPPEEDQPPPPILPADGPGPRELPKIFVLAGQRHRAVDEGLAALRDARVPFFNRAGEIVRIEYAPAKTTDGSLIKAPAIKPVPLPALGRALGQVARWMRHGPPPKRVPYRIDPPFPVVEQLAKACERWPFLPLVGITRVPTMRTDFSLLTEEGYDPATCLWAAFGSLQLPRIPARPTRQEAETALKLLLEVADNFPLVDERSRAAAIAAEITPVVRGAIDVAPLFSVTAPAPASGKSYLVDCAAAIATGDRAAVTAVAPRDEETEKRLIGDALSGRPILCLDNVRRPLQGDFLCQLTERPLLSVRPLGTTDKCEIKNTFTLFANGNNLVAADDMVRRSLRISLDANCERPELREFDSDPRAEILERRGHYIAACLTIVRYYIAAGRPNLRPRLASYGQWSDLVRSPLVHLGLADPVDTQLDLRTDDPVLQNRTQIFAAWRECKTLAPGDARGLRVRELIELAQADQSGDLLEALLEVGEGQATPGKFDRARLARWLGHNEDTIADGVKLICDRGDRQRPRWRLAPVIGE